MNSHLAFDDLMTRLRDGDDEAAWEVFAHYASRLIALARQRLSTQTRPRLDPEDVVQSVFRSFFGRYANGQFQLENWDGLWALLALITVRKCSKKNARFQKAADEALADSAFAREPSPEDAAILTETVEELMSGLKERERPMLVLRLQDYSVREISEQLDCTERKVQRVLARVRERLEELVTADERG